MAYRASMHLCDRLRQKYYGARVPSLDPNADAGRVALLVDRFGSVVGRGALVMQAGRRADRTRTNSRSTRCVGVPARTTRAFACARCGRAATRSNIQTTEAGWAVTPPAATTPLIARVFRRYVTMGRSGGEGGFKGSLNRLMDCGRVFV